METKKTIQAIADVRGKSFDGLKVPVSPRFVARRQNLFDVYNNNESVSLKPRDIGHKVLDQEVSDDTQSVVKLALPGKKSKATSQLKVKKPLMPKIRSWALKITFSFACLALIAGGFFDIQGYKYIHKAQKGEPKSLAVMQANVNPHTSAAANLSTQSQVSSNAQPLEANITKENAPVLVLNGTPVHGLAATAENVLKADGYNVIADGNAPTNNYSQTIVIDLANNKDNYTNQYLDQRYNTTSVTSLSDISIQTNGASFVIILGSDETINSQG